MNLQDALASFAPAAVGRPVPASDPAYKARNLLGYTAKSKENKELCGFASGPGYAATSRENKELCGFACGPGYAAKVQARQQRIAAISPILHSRDIPDPPEDIGGFMRGTAPAPRFEGLMRLAEKAPSLDPLRRVIHDVIPTLTASGSYTEADKEATLLHNIKLLHEQVAVGLLELRSSRPAEGGEGTETRVWTKPGASVEGYAPLVPECASAPEVGDPATSAHYDNQPIALGCVRKHSQGPGSESISIGGSGGSQLLYREMQLPSGDRQVMSNLIHKLREAGMWAHLTPIGEGAEQVSVVKQVMCHLIDGKGRVYLHAPSTDDLTAAGLLTADDDLLLSACKRVKTGDTKMDESLEKQKRGIELTGNVNKLAHIRSMPITGPLYTQREVAPEADTVRLNTHPTSFRQAPVVVASESDTQSIGIA